MKKIVLLGLLAIWGASAAAESPQDWAFEVRLGWYKPHIDSEQGLQLVNGEGPYARIFGNQPYPLLELELEYQIIRLFGTLGAGVSVGHFLASGHGIYASTPENIALGIAGSPSGDTTTLRLVPVRLLAVWRVDELWRRWSIPFEPFLKLGAGPTFYWVANGQGNTSYYNGERGGGLRLGWEASGGLAFLLDFLDQTLARDFDAEFGVNHSYLFAEYRINQTGLIGKAGFNLSDNFFTFGIAFEF